MEMKIGIGIRNIPMTWNPELTIISILSGQVSICINNDSYKVKENEIIIVNCDDAYSLNCDFEDSIYLIFNVNVYDFDKHIEAISRVLYFCRPSIYTDVQKQLISKINNKFAQIWAENNKKEIGYEGRSVLIMVDVLKILAYNFNSIGKSPDSYKSVEQAQRMWLAFEYIYNNYTNKISLKDVASHVHVSEAYLSKCIKQDVNVNFEEWLNIVRTEYSLKPLITTNMSINQISYNCGFSDPKYYNKAFKKYFGYSPKEYREKNKIINYKEITWNEITADYNLVDEKYKKIISKKIVEFMSGNRVESITKQEIEIFLNWGLKGNEIQKKDFLTVDIGHWDSLQKKDVISYLESIKRELKVTDIKLSNIIEDISKKEYEFDKAKTLREFEEAIRLIIGLNYSPVIWIDESSSKVKGFFDIVSLLLQKLKLNQGKLESLKIQIGCDSSNKINAMAIESQINQIALNMGLFINIEICYDVLEENNLLYDTGFITPYIIKKIIDRTFDYQNELPLLDNISNNLFSGNRGLMTIHGIRKPVFYAYYFIGKLGNEILKAGDGYLTTKINESIQTVFYNTPQYVNDEYLKIMDVSQGYWGSQFELEEIKKYKFKMNGLSQGEYLLQRYQFNGENGSILNHILNSKAINYIDQESAIFLEQGCKPRMFIDYIENVDDIELEIEVKSNCAEIIIIKKIV